MLVKAGKHYGEGIIKEYSKRLTSELNKNYSPTTLKYIRKFYEFSKSHSLSDQLTYTHYKILMSLKDNNKINYYIKISIADNLSVRELATKVKNNEYERLPAPTKQKLIKKEEIQISDLVKNPIFVRNKKNYEIVTEKALHKLIMEDIQSFLKELGSGFSFIENEYKIKLGESYNYIDFLLYNIEFNCYVVIELKVTELKKEHIGQIEIYMNYIDNNLKTFAQGKTIGIIICKKNNHYIIEYCSDKRIISKEYQLI